MATQSKPLAPWGTYVPYLGPTTVEQFEQFPAAEGWVYELHEGRVIAMPGPGSEHADIQENLFMTLGNYVRANALGRLRGTSCYNLPLPHTGEELLCPDLSYASPSNTASMPMRGSFPVGAPEMVIEIASPSDSHPALARKVGIYLQAGVQLVWVVWPRAGTIDIWLPSAPHAPSATRGGTDLIDGAPVFPAFQCAVREILRP